VKHIFARFFSYFSDGRCSAIQSIRLSSRVFSLWRDASPTGVFFFPLDVSKGTSLLSLFFFCFFFFFFWLSLDLLRLSHHAIKPSFPIVVVTPSARCPSLLMSY